MDTQTCLNHLPLPRWHTFQVKNIFTIIFGGWNKILQFFLSVAKCHASHKAQPTGFKKRAHLCKDYGFPGRARGTHVWQGVQRWSPAFMGLIASKTATQSQKRFLTKRQSGLESAQSGLGISSKLWNVEYHLISPLDTPATGPKHAGEDPRTLPHSLGLVSSKLRSPRKKRFLTKRQSGLESDGQICRFRPISSTLRNVV